MWQRCKAGGPAVAEWNVLHSWKNTQSHRPFIMLILVLFLFFCSNLEVHLVRFYSHNNFPVRARTHTHTQSINLSMHVQQSPPPPPPSPPHTNNVSITQSNTHQNQLQQNNAQWPYVSFGPSGWLNACLWFFVYINWTAAQHFRGHVVGRSVDHGRVNIYTHLHINIILLQCLCVCGVCMCMGVICSINSASHQPSCTHYARTHTCLIKTLQPLTR